MHRSIVRIVPFFVLVCMVACASEATLPGARRPLEFVAASPEKGSQTVAEESEESEESSEASLAAYFGFSPVRTVVVNDSFGPTIAADINGDGLQDIVTVNNQDRRIEVHLQRVAKRTENAMGGTANELPKSPWYDLVKVNVSHRIGAVLVHDVNDDGRPDLLYTGQPSEIVAMLQQKDGSFTQGARRRVRGLAANHNSFLIANTIGDARPEVLALVDGQVQMFPLSKRGELGDPISLGSSAEEQKFVAFTTEDYNGDGRTDVLAVVPDDAAPLRLWLQRASQGAAGSELGPELRFEMPALLEVETLRFADRKAASIAVIEKSSQRVVCYDLATEPIESVGTGAERDVRAEAIALQGSGGAAVVADINADGMPDVLTTHPKANGVVLHRQESQRGFGRGVFFGSFTRPSAIAAGQWDSDPELEIMVTSQAENVVGVSEYDPHTGKIGFPTPLPLQTAGATPVAMHYAMLKSGPAIVVVMKDRRDYVLEIHRPDDATNDDGPEVVELDDVRRAPKTIRAADIDHDGRTDFMLLTPNEPMVLLLAEEEGWTICSKESMPHFGLVQSAGPDNTALLDMDNDNQDELLLASENFIRACAYDREHGWRVVEQATVEDAAASFVSVAVDRTQGGAMGELLVADKGEGRLLRFVRSRTGSWEVKDRLRLLGFEPGPLYTGVFTGKRESAALVLGRDAFAVVRFAGQRASLKPFAFFRAENEHRYSHEFVAGDINGDGFLDLTMLDAKQQMCQILTFSAARTLHKATEFKVFETRMFQNSYGRSYDPSGGFVADLTGDGAADLTLFAHDRILIYPQMTAPTSSSKVKDN